MLKKILAITMLIAVMSSGIMAADDAVKSGSSANSLKTIEKKSEKGFVVSLENDSIIIVKDNNQQITFKIEKSTKFIDAPNNNSLVTANDIAVDDRVRVDVKEGDSAYQVVKLITDLIKKKQ